MRAIPVLDLKRRVADRKMLVEFLGRMVKRVVPPRRLRRLAKSIRKLFGVSLLRQPVSRSLCKSQETPACLLPCVPMVSNYRHPGNLGFHLGFDMNCDERLSVHIGFQGFLDPVANLMGIGHATVAWDDKVELDESHAPGMPGSHIMRLDRARRVLPNQFLDGRYHFGRRRFVHQPRGALAHHLISGPQNVDADQPCHNGIERE
jgi:hypothetical protein